jgi:hypothetical protein
MPRQLSSVLSCIILVTLHSLASADLTCSSSCTDIFSSEFDESRLVCNKAATNCQCKFHLLDVTACVVTNGSNDNKIYDLSGFEVQNTSSSRYTAACKSTILEAGTCSIRGVSDKGIPITLLDAIFAALGISLELILFYQLVVSLQATKFWLSSQSISALLLKSYDS